MQNMAMEHPLVGATALLDLAAFGFAVPGAWLGKRALRTAGLVLLIAGFTLNTWVIAERWIEAGRPPFKTLFETLLFYPWCVGLVALILIGLYRVQSIVFAAAGISVAGLIYALYRPDVELVNLPPALQSAWFVPHVVTYFVSYAALFLSCALAAFALFAPRFESSRNAHGVLRGLDPYYELQAHRAACFGVAALTAGLLMGGMWAKFAWGDYWSWDPKENWALATWLAYMLYLHLRLLEGWGGRRAMWVLVLAFAAVMFTYLGVSMLPSASGSLHVYQK